MNNSDFEALTASIMSNAVLTEADFLALRRTTGQDFHISADEAQALFDINDMIAAWQGTPQNTPQNTLKGWREYFINAITVYVLDQGRPQGYVSDSSAAWLITRIAKDGHVDSETEIGLLMSVLKLAQSIPERLKIFTLDIVYAAIVDGTGYWGKNRSFQPGVIGEAETELLRDVLYATGGAGSSGISKMEAEMLFKLNDACTSAQKLPRMAKAICNGSQNYVMVLRAPDAPDAREALRRENWLADRSPTGFFKLQNLLNRKTDKAEEMLLPRNLQSDAANEAERITNPEAVWLVEQLKRRSGIDDNEAALLTFLQRECPDIDGALRPLLRRA